MTGRTVTIHGQSGTIMQIDLHYQVCGLDGRLTGTTIAGLARWCATGIETWTRIPRREGPVADAGHTEREVNHEVQDQCQGGQEDRRVNRRLGLGRIV